MLQLITRFRVGRVLTGEQLLDLLLCLSAHLCDHNRAAVSEPVTRTTQEGGGGRGDDIPSTCGSVATPTVPVLASAGRSNPRSRWAAGGAANWLTRRVDQLGSGPPTGAAAAAAAAAAAVGDGAR